MGNTELLTPPSQNQSSDFRNTWVCTGPVLVRYASEQGRQGFERKLPPGFALGRRKRPPLTVWRYTGGGCVPKRRSAETELNPTRVLSSKEESTKTAFGAPVPKTRLQSTVPTLGDPALTREVLLPPEQWLAGSSESWRWSQKTCLSLGPSVRGKFPTPWFR